MPTLTERIDAQITEQTAERTRIQARTADALLEVDRNLAVLTAAKKALTKDVEQAYAALIAAKLIREI